MIGLLIVTHSNLGKEFLSAAEFIVGRVEAADTVSITETTDSEGIRKMIQEKVDMLDHGQGVLILTDMFGGSPSNLSYSFLEEGQVEVISGVNLPILIKALDAQEDMELSQFAESLEAFGKKSISLASGILKGNKRK